jgi:transposase-like protein
MAEKKQTSPEKKVREIRRQTRKKYTAEEKIRIILEGLCGEDSIAELCRKEGIHPNLYYNWSKEFLENNNITHVRGKPFHPQTQGKIERYHRTMKNVIKLENYYLPEDLEQTIQKFVDYYNNERYHESLNNLTPADVYFGRDKEILAKRKQIKKETLIMRRKQYQKSKIKQLTSY